MPRVAAALIAAAALAAIALVPTAAATPKACVAASPNVIGGSIAGKLTSSNVNKVQAGLATCRHAKKVMKKVAALGLEKPRSVKAFYCRPTVLSTGPDVVSYVCTFKGADTAMFVKLTFTVTYPLD
jgi:fructose-1,6-bisphosphatase/sedoheptulose 1,7-bisphosphatase-like protein